MLHKKERKKESAGGIVRGEGVIPKRQTERTNEWKKEKKAMKHGKYHKKKTQNDRSYTKIVVSINRLNSLIKWQKLLDYFLKPHSLLYIKGTFKEKGKKKKTWYVWKTLLNYLLFQLASTKIF